MLKDKMMSMLSSTSKLMILKTIGIIIVILVIIMSVYSIVNSVFDMFAGETKTEKIHRLENNAKVVEVSHKAIIKKIIIKHKMEVLKIRTTSEVIKQESNLDKIISKNKLRIVRHRKIKRYVHRVKHTVTLTEPLPVEEKPKQEEIKDNSIKNINTVFSMYKTIKGL